MGIYILGLLALAAFSAFVTVQQGTVAVVTIFGKYQRMMRPGLNFRIPFIEQIFKRISTQNKSVEIEFQAITQDQANVHFKTLIIFAVMDDNEETVKKAAFKFINEANFIDRKSVV